MTEERTVTVEGKRYVVVLSDDTETLLAAKAAGRVPVGLWRKNGAELSMVRYLAESADDADESFLERVIRREMGMPWIIAESDRLRLREFTAEDWKSIPKEASDSKQDRIFCGKETLEAYIQNQYGFYEFGVWAAERKEDGALLGTVGIVGTEEGEQSELWMELGYHVFEPFRRQGYALEACLAVLDYVHEMYEARMYARTDVSNRASRGLLEKLGFAEYQLQDGEDLIWYCEK